MLNLEKVQLRQVQEEEEGPAPEGPAKPIKLASVSIFYCPIRDNNIILMYSVKTYKNL